MVRLERESRFAETTSMPFWARARADGLLVLRVMARIFQDGSLRKVETTEPPWVPVAPMMAISLVVDMVVVGGVYLEGQRRETSLKNES